MIRWSKEHMDRLLIVDEAESPTYWMERARSVFVELIDRIEELEERLDECESRLDAGGIYD